MTWTADPGLMISCRSHFSSHDSSRDAKAGDNTCLVKTCLIYFIRLSLWLSLLLALVSTTWGSENRLNRIKTAEQGGEKCEKMKMNKHSTPDHKTCTLDHRDALRADQFTTATCHLSVFKLVFRVSKPSDQYGLAEHLGLNVWKMSAEQLPKPLKNMNQMTLQNTALD